MGWDGQGWEWEWQDEVLVWAWSAFLALPHMIRIADTISGPMAQLVCILRAC